MKHAIVLGTRPEIIKLAPVVWALKERRLPFVVIDTGQHDSPEMSAWFYGSMGYEPDISFANFSIDATPGLIRGVIDGEGYDLVIVQGDTDSGLAGAIAAQSAGVNLAHVEAGLRSRDLSMREERNRIAIDAMSRSCFAPTREAVINLRGFAHLTGNTIADVLNVKGAERKAGKHILMTLHRREIVDDPHRVRVVILGAVKASRELGLPLVFPVHPRTADLLERNDIPLPRSIDRRRPERFEDFLRLEEEAALIITDSGGVQEEACILGVPCVTVRSTTERPETIGRGANTLAWNTDSDIVSAALDMVCRSGWKHPYGDGNAGDRIVDILMGKE